MLVNTAMVHNLRIWVNLQATVGDESATIAVQVTQGVEIVIICCSMYRIQ